MDSSKSSDHQGTTTITLNGEYIQGVEKHLEGIILRREDPQEFLNFCLKEAKRPLPSQDEEEAEKILSERLTLLKSIYPDFQEFQVEELKIERDISLLFKLWQMWLPLAEVYLEGWQEKQKTAAKNTPFLVLFSGAQGSGKTVTTSVLKWLIPQLGKFKSTTSKCSVSIISIDSLYKTNRERIQLRNQLRLKEGLRIIEARELPADKKEEVETLLRQALQLTEEIELILGTPKEHLPQEGKLLERSKEEKIKEVEDKLKVSPQKLQDLTLKAIGENPFYLSFEVREKVLQFYLEKCSLEGKEREKIREAAAKGNPFYEVARGLPNTHYVDKFLNIYKGFCEGRDKVELPEFEKLFHGGVGDVKAIERIPPEEYPDIFILEGWFVGVPTNLSLEEVEKIIRTDDYVRKVMDSLDPERRYVEVMWEYLQPYQKIWDIFDNRTFMLIENIRNVERSRAHQEKTNRKHRIAELKRQGLTDAEISQMKLGMTDEEIAHFVQPYILLTYIILYLDLFQYGADIIFRINSSDYLPRSIAIRRKEE